MATKSLVPGAIIDQIRALISGGPNGLVTKYPALAEQLDVAEDIVRDAVATLKQQGQVHVTPAGRQGVRLTAPAAAPSATRPHRQATAATRGSFCPWCGTESAADWRYCANCGKGLPKSLGV